MGSNIVAELPMGNQYYVGPTQTGSQNYQSTLRLMYAMNHAAQFWASKADENADAKDHNGLMILIAIYSIINNLHDHIEAASKIFGATKGELSNVHLPRAMKKMNQTVVNYGEEKFSLKARFSAKFIDEEKGFAWLEEIGEDKAVKKTIHHATLNSLVERYIKEELITPPNDAVEVKMQDHVNIKRV